MFLTHYLQALAVISVVGSLTICTLLIFEPGRAFLRRLGNLIRRDPLDAVIVFGLTSVMVAFGGSKPEPPPIVVQKGIRLISVTQTPEQIAFSWAPDDRRIHPDSTYLIQEAQGGRWQTLASTTATNYVHRRFTIARDRRYRIAVDVSEEDAKQ